jgi:hypothetical protein
VAAEELARPGVEVIQEFRTVTPSVITPTLVPNIVGVCRQVVEVLESDGAGGTQLNPDALVQMPAFFIATDASGTPLRYTGLDGLSLVVSVNEGPDVSLIFSDPTVFGLTPATVVDQINKALLAALVTSVVAETVGTSTWQLRTTGTGEFQSILISSSTSPVVASTFGIGIGKTYTGLTSYNQYEVQVPPTSLPDPRSNLDELAVEKDTIRSFFFTGSGSNLQEAKRTEAFLQKGDIADKAETTEGTVALTSFPTFYGEVLWLKVDGGEVQVVTITGLVTTSTQLLALLNGTLGFTGVEASLGTSSGLVFTHNTGGYDHTIEILTPDTNSANTKLGLTAETVRGVSIEAVDDGNGDAVTPLLEFSGVDFTASPASAVLTGTGAPTLPPPANSTLILSDGQQPQTVTFAGTETTLPLLIAAIDAVMGVGAGGRLVTSDSAGNLRFTNSWLGDGSFIEVIGGTALQYLDSGTNPPVSTEASQSLSPHTGPVMTTGTVDLTDGSSFPTLATQTFTVDIGAGPVTVTLASDATFAALKANIEGTVGLVGEVLVTRALGTTGGMVITGVGTTVGAASSITLAEGTGALALLGLTAEVKVGVDVFPTLGTETFDVVYTSGPGATPTTYTVTLASETAFAALKANIEGTVTNATATQGPNGGLVLTGDPANTGSAATFEFVENAGGAALLGLPTGVVFAGNGEVLVAGATDFGSPFQPLPGDELWVDGSFFATVTKAAPGGVTNRLRINRQVPINEDIGRYFYIVAQNIVAGAAANGVTRPYPNLSVDLEGTIVLQPNQLRDIKGDPVPGKAPLYVSYNAIRQDVSALANQPGLLRFDSTTAVEQQLAPINTDNPLALGLFFALINAPGIQVTGLGVDEATADAPDGTLEGFTRAAEYLEGYEVYAIAPMTHDQTVAQVFSTHSSFMSRPENKGERITLWNPSVPTRELDTLVASGVNGDGLTSLTFDSKVVTLSALLSNAGVNPVGTIPVEEGVYLDIAGDSNRYSIESLTGGIVTIRTVFQAGTNEDGFYSTTALTLPIISTAFAIRVRGAELLTPTGQQDKARVAATMSGLGQSFGSRRLWMTFPDRTAATLEGLEQVIDGYYLNAGIAGMTGQQPPQQSFTNFPMTGYTRVLGSNDTFNERQLNQMAAGGTYIIVQDTEGGPLTARMALTTDMTSIETRTDSITKVVDFTAKFMRRGLRNFIGRFNITQGFLDTLGSVIQGLGGFLVETGVLIGLTLNSIVQDENARDTVLVDTTLDPPYPCNYIRLTLVV